MPQLNCLTCTAAQKLDRGCETDAKASWKDGNEYFKRCPRRFFLENAEEYQELLWSYVNFRERSLLPSAGGIDDQVGEWVQLMQVIDRAHNDAQKDLREKNKT